MNVRRICAETSHTMFVDDTSYYRDSGGNWTFMMSYDIHFEYENCSPELSKQLEEVFQEYKDFADIKV